MKIIGYITDENEKLFDIEIMKKTLGTSRSKIQREIRRNGFSEILKYKNLHLYSENTFYQIIEKMLLEKQINKYGL